MDIYLFQSSNSLLLERQKLSGRPTVNSLPFSGRLCGVQRRGPLRLSPALRGGPVPRRLRGGGLYAQQDPQQPPGAGGEGEVESGLLDRRMSHTRLLWTVIPRVQNFG